MNSTPQFPRLVMIIRHGEKPGAAGTDKDGGPHLSVLGATRAAALPSLFTPAPNVAGSSGPRQLCCGVTAGAASQFGGAYGASGDCRWAIAFPNA